jgi:hypothetical protein
MVREIYFRDASDSQYQNTSLEATSEREIILNKVRMILLSSKGEILGAPELGMDLETYLFDKILPADLIKNKFYAQVAQFIPESSEHSISLEIGNEVEDYHNIAVLKVKIDGIDSLGISL